jgi:ethanolamine transporter EutH
MRKRLLACLIFGATGIAAALPIGDHLGISMVPSLIGGLLAGVFIGYLVSVFLDIFLSNSTSEIEN